MSKLRKQNNEDRGGELERWDPFSGTMGLRDAMDRLFDESLWAPFGAGRSMSRAFPEVDVSETDDEVIVRANVPGIDPKDVGVEVTDNTLSLSGTIAQEEEEKDENYHRVERVRGSFSRQFRLPDIDPDSVTAKSKDGLLTITLKKSEAQKRRKVEIENG
jgi:HSP20 family protein